MKAKILKTFTVVLLLPILSSCELIESLADVDFDINIPVTFYVKETAVSNSPKNFSDMRTLDLSKNSDIIKYGDKLKKFKVNRITYSISNVNPEAVFLTDASVSISSGKTIASISEIKLENSSETDLVIDKNGVNELCQAVLDQQREEIKLNGTVSSTPISCTITIKVYFTVTANALK